MIYSYFSIYIYLCFRQLMVAAMQRAEVITVQRLAKEAVHRAQLARGDTPLSCIACTVFSAFPVRRCGLAQPFIDSYLNMTMYDV